MATINDIEQLCFLGMRLALRSTIPSSELRDHARSCAKRRNQNLMYWIQNEKLPHVELKGLENVQLARGLGKGLVITSFQIGPYNWIPLILNWKAHLPVTLLMDAANFKQEQRRWASRETNYDVAIQEPVRCINAEEPTAFWKMFCSLREQRIVAGWYDGLTGFTEAQSSKGAVSVSFCETSIRVRTGLAYLTARTGAPLILAVMRNMAGDGIGVHFEDPLIRSEKETVEDFCYRASQELVHMLEREVRADLACWEEWCHFHSRNIFQPRRPLSDLMAKGDFLLTRWRLDQDNVDCLAMSDGDVLVSLTSGQALAMTPLVSAVLNGLTTWESDSAVSSSLLGRFSQEELNHAMRALYEGRFVVETS